MQQSDEEEEEEACVQFYEDGIEMNDDDDGVDSDYGDNLIEVYEHAGNEEDINNYKGIHLMDKGNSNPNEDEKYQCPDTGSHFEFLDMCQRLKNLQKRRTLIDKVIEEEENKKALKKAMEIESELKPKLKQLSELTEKGQYK